jgi:hypothetical protein
MGVAGTCYPIWGAVAHTSNTKKKIPQNKFKQATDEISFKFT